jgi:predicted acyl esterase
MPNEIRDIQTTDTSSFPYIFEQNVSVPLKGSAGGLIRCNVYRPKVNGNEPVPVIVTYGPYGKDIPYEM